jgi:Tfp pilus assembly protein PilX
VEQWNNRKTIECSWKGNAPLRSNGLLLDGDEMKCVWPKMSAQIVKNERGTALIAAVATLLILSLMGMVVVSMVGTEEFSAVHQAQSLDAYWVAEAGAHKALTYLSRESGNCTTITGASAFTDVALGGGTFTVTATRYNPSPTAINDADGITAGDTTITVDSTTGFAPFGRIAIESELINYTAITATTFTGAQRGVDGTTAAAHADNIAVSQYQCSIVSTGTLSAGFGDATRSVEAVVQ